MDDETSDRNGKPRGIINPHRVKFISFLIISISVIACAVLCILAIWDFAQGDAIWRSIATLGVISFAVVAFAFANEKFG